MVVYYAVEGETSTTTVKQGSAGEQDCINRGLIKMVSDNDDATMSAQADGTWAVDPIRVREQFKKERQAQVDNIEVTYNTNIYQGDETSQDRMSRAINGLPDDVVTITWVTSDNVAVQLTKPDLRAILYDAGMQQEAIWLQP